MFTRIYSGAVMGIEGRLVCVETDISNGFPAFSLVGYLASEVREAKERVSSAIKNSGSAIPAKRIIVNLSPADLRKQGTCYDFPIALGILGALNVINPEVLEGIFAVGELSLDGSIHSVKGILPLILMAKEQGFRRCFVPADNLREASLVQQSGDGSMEIFGFSDLKAACAYLMKGVYQESISCKSSGEQDATSAEAKKTAKDYEDFSMILGQESLKRGIVAAVSGMHHFLMIGVPGSGKSLSARAMQGILPPMTLEESLEVTRLYSVAGMLKDSGLVCQRPFRSPHHTIPARAMTGGGHIPSPGEISLAHHGILFLDELAEFAPSVLEVLRQPMEEGKIVLNRVHGSYTFPASFMLVAAMNPCRCGYYPDRNRCHCTSGDVYRYLHKISRPLWNRFDMCAQVQQPLFNKKEDSAALLDTAAMAEMVRKARQMQADRFKGEGIDFNSRIPGDRLEHYCGMDGGAASYAKKLADILDLNMRSFHKLLRVARTVADLDDSVCVMERHLDEAACYRMIEHTYWEI